MRTEDVAAVAEIERMSFGDPWSAAAFLAELRNPRSLRVVAIDGERVAGFAVGRLVPDELEVNDLAVRPAARGRGVGRALVRAVLECGRLAGAATAWLEVRPSNRAALALYSGLGFRPVARRRGYYRDGEDAVVMRCDLDPAVAAGSGALA